MLEKAEQNFEVIKQEYYKITEDKLEKTEQLPQMDKDIKKLEVKLKSSINTYYGNENKFVNNFESKSYIEQDYAKGVT